MGVKDKMDFIQTTFLEAKSLASHFRNLDELNNALLKFPKEFISVAYEGASMELALLDLESSMSLSTWTEFYTNFALAHSNQMHVGLGWAMAESDYDVSSLALDSFLLCRVLDGYGYYEGIFRKRKSIRTQEVPVQFSANELHAYDQGLGRSLWYSAMGDVDKLLSSINLFSQNRKQDLWRGVGIAVSYVGGMDKATIQQLVLGADEFAPSFKTGAIILIHSRLLAHTIVEDTEMISEAFFGKNCDDLHQKLLTLKASNYLTWVQNIENTFCSKLTING